MSTIFRSQLLSEASGNWPGQVAGWLLTLHLTLLGWALFRVPGIDDLSHAVLALVLFDGRFELTAMGLGNASPVGAWLALTA